MARRAATPKARLGYLRRKEALRLSAGLDPDERHWRSLSGGRAGVSAATHERMQRLAYELWLTNLMGQRLIEMVTDHVVGEGVAWQSEDPRALSCVQGFWADPVNQLDLRI